VGERGLAFGVTAVVLTVTQALSAPSQGIDATIECHHGYGKVTSRIVIQELRTNWMMNGEPFNTNTLQELQPD